MRKISFALLALISVQTLFPINIAEEWEAIRILEERIKSQYVYSWFALGASSLIAARFLSNRIAILEQELKEKWFWNPETQQEELPADADQTTLSFMYWGKQAATLTGCLALIWGIKQGFHVAGLRMYMKLKETIVKAAQEEEQEKQYYNQQNDPGFQRWRKRNPYGSYNEYCTEELMNMLYETADAGFRQWRQTNPGGSYQEYRSGGSSSSSGAHPNPQKPAAPQPPLDDYYTILGVTRTATNAQIKRAYLALAKENHPSTTRSANTLDDSERKARENKFKNITDAYDTLKDSTLKAVYDRNWSTTTEHARRTNVALASRAQSEKNQQDAEAEAKRKAGKK
jgi:DnaJ-domain-containing protein 1